MITSNVIRDLGYSYKHAIKLPLNKMKVTHGKDGSCSRYAPQA